MKRNSGFTPTCTRLEVRVVLSHARVARAPSVVVSGLSPAQNVLNTRQQMVVAEVNQAFLLFQSDYGQARATYFAAILGQPSTGPAAADAVNAFQLYTEQRVSLLAQQITSSLLQYNVGTARTAGHANTIKLLIASDIINPRKVNPATKLPTGQLFQSLVGSTPTPATVSAPTETLYTLSQNDAIEVANDAVLNAVGILRNGDFGNQVSH
jgi:hypothetical protein